MQDPVDVDEVKELIEGLEPGSFAVEKETLLDWNRGFQSRIQQIGLSQLAQSRSTYAHSRLTWIAYLRFDVKKLNR